MTNSFRGNPGGFLSALLNARAGRRPNVATRNMTEVVGDVPRFEGNEVQNIRDEIDRFAGNRFQQAAQSMRQSGTDLTGQSVQGIDAVSDSSLDDPMEQIAEPESADTTDNSSVSDAAVIGDSGTDEYYEALYPKSVTTVFNPGKGPSTLGFNFGGSPNSERTDYEYIGNPIPDMPEIPTNPGPVDPGPVDPGPGPTPTPEPGFEDRSLVSFGRTGSTTYTGAQAIGRANQYGYSDSDIKQKLVDENLKVGENAARSLGLSNLVGEYGGNAADNMQGLAGIDRARQFLDDDLIKRFGAEQGVKYGDKAAESLGLTNLAQYNESGGFTTGALKEAQRYLTDAQIRTAAGQQGVDLNAIGFGGGNPNPAGSKPAPSDAARDIGESYNNVNPQFSSNDSIGEAGLERMAADRGISFYEARRQAEAAGMYIGERARAR